MVNFFNLIKFNIKQKKKLFLILCIITAVVLILAILAGFNLQEGLFTVDLSNICYIRFLRGDCGWSGLFFGLIFSLLIFILLILIFSSKIFLFPLAILFYLYFIYSQFIFIVNLILIYGILNCIILVLLLITFNLLLICLFLFMLLDLTNHYKNGNYFKNCLNSKYSIVPVCLIGVLVLCLIFSLILIVLKSFVLILIF